MISKLLPLENHLLNYFIIIFYNFNFITMRSLNFLLAISIFTTILFTSCQKENVNAGDAITIISGQDFLDRKELTKGDSPKTNHYSLNLVGVPDDKFEAFYDDERSEESIYVGLRGNSRVMLRKASQDEGFGIIEANGLEDVAIFQLPTLSETEYQLFVRPLGIPRAESQPHDVDPSTNEDIASMGTIIIVKGNGADRDTDIGSKLMTVNVAAEDINRDDVIDELDITTYKIFDEVLEGYLWEYNDEGLKVSQLRFYFND